MEINTTLIQSLITSGAITNVQIPTDTSSTHLIYAGGLISPDRTKAMLYDSISKEWYLNTSLNINGIDSSLFIHYDSADTNNRDIYFPKGFRFCDDNETVSIDNAGDGSLEILLNEQSPRFYVELAGYSATSYISADYLRITLRAGYDGGGDAKIIVDGEDEGSISLQATAIYANGSPVMTTANFTLSPDGTTLTITTK